MNQAGPSNEPAKLNTLQLIKLLVYGLLLINFVLYIYDDWSIAQHTLGPGSSFFDWTSAYAVSIDESAWFILLFLFELETYVMSDAAFTRGRVLLMHGVRFICYGFLMHTLWAYGNSALDLQQVEAIPAVTDLCELSDRELSFAYNLEYTELDASNCASLSNGSALFLIEPPDFLVVTNSAGLVIEKQLIWIDLFEAMTWLLILFTIELNVRIQDKGIASGRWISSLAYSKMLLYGLLWGAAGYWIYRGHYMYAWDEFVWIAGFSAIEVNMAKWRKEIKEAGAAT
ncbi:hypothetical protein [Oceanicoccus sagamiensis]|uniref:Shikimate kinase n=1 Tax=Oceanicoccus sagamiensis TaxID=716816 RepID=A0A1X9N675_9GAMM|nr:hypothetical protein [Oceanicoccus sagamiensis]ARN72674.1 hypothetical protein BST96_00220 [Oceanicoccus sagamiensis]